MEDRVQRIIELEAEAERDLGSASKRNWQAAELIYEEVKGGTSMRGLGAQIGKSHTHVRRMCRSWELVGAKLPEDARPSFYDIYNSGEVRGDVAEQPSVSTPSAKRAEREEEDTTERDDAHAWVARADDAIRNLTNFPESVRWLDDREVGILAGIPARIRTVLSAVDRRTGSQRAS